MEGEVNRVLINFIANCGEINLLDTIMYMYPHEKNAREQITLVDLYNVHLVKMNFIYSESIQQ